MARNWPTVALRAALVLVCIDVLLALLVAVAVA